MSDSDATPTADVSPDEVERLRLENEKLKAELAEVPMRGHRGKSILSAFLIIVACLLAPLSVTAVWAKSEVSDTNRYVETVAPLASDPSVQAAVSERITAEIFKYVSIEELTNEAVSAITSLPNVPPKAAAALDALTGPIASGIESFIADQITKIIQSPQFAEAWTQANTVAHTQLVNLLSGSDMGAIAVQDNKVTLNLASVVTEVKAKLVERGFTVAENIPTVNTSIVLFESDSIGKAQAAYSALNTIGFWLPIIVIIMGVIAVFVANVKHVALIGLGIGLLISMGISSFLIGFAKIGYMNALPATVNRAAAETIFNQLTLFLREALQTGVVLGILFILAGIFVGPGRFGAGVRGLFVKLAAAIQGQLYSWGATMTTVRGYVRQAATGLRIAALILAVIFVLIQEYKTAGHLIWTTVVLLVVLFIIQVLASDEKPEVEARDDQPSDIKVAT